MSETVSPSFIELTTPSSMQTDRRKAHCEDWRKSGLSMSEYCRRAGLSVSSLSGWVKKFNGNTSTKLKNNLGKILTPLKRQEMEIILLSGIRLKFADTGNVSEIIRLIKALELCS
jgi:transposase